MRWRVRTMAAWSRADSADATQALLEMADTKIQQGWFPAYVHMHLAMNGSAEVVTKLKQLFPKVERGTISRGLEQIMYGKDLLAFTRPHLDEQTLCYVRSE